MTSKRRSNKINLLSLSFVSKCIPKAFVKELFLLNIERARPLKSSIIPFYTPDSTFDRFNIDYIVMLPCKNDHIKMIIY